MADDDLSGHLVIPGIVGVASFSFRSLTTALETIKLRCIVQKQKKGSSCGTNNAGDSNLHLLYLDLHALLSRSSRRTGRRNTVQLLSFPGERTRPNVSVAAGRGHTPATGARATPPSVPEFGTSAASFSRKRRAAPVSTPRRHCCQILPRPRRFSVASVVVLVCGGRQWQPRWTRHGRRVDEAMASVQLVRRAFFVERPRRCRGLGGPPRTGWPEHALDGCDIFLAMCVVD